MERRLPAASRSLTLTLKTSYTMYFDRNRDIDISFKSHLPHMHQDETMQFVTFRLADSLPKSVCQDFYDRVKLFKAANPEPWNRTVKLMYWKEFGPMQQQYLDNGYGECWLKYSACREILIDAIAFKDNVNYIVDSYVIMPNHVHILFQPIGMNKTESILHSIKSYSANKINKLVGRSGKLWMKESFDRMIRDEDDHKRKYLYILENPKFLPDGWFTVYVRGGK